MEGGYEKPSVAPIYDIYYKNACYLSALQNIGIKQNSTEEITEFETAPCHLETSNKIVNNIQGIPDLT